MTSQEDGRQFPDDDVLFFGKWTSNFAGFIIAAVNYPTKEGTFEMLIKMCFVRSLMKAQNFVVDRFKAKNETRALTLPVIAANYA